MCNNKNWVSEIIRDEAGKLKKEYILPIIIERDPDYKSKLKNLMAQLRVALESNGDLVKYANVVSLYDDFFSRILDAQYAGDLVAAQGVAHEIIENLRADDDSIAFSTIRKSIAFTDMEYALAKEEVKADDVSRKSAMQFYRARISDTYTKYTRLEMLHVPFDKRQYVSNERFSISGLPCLYLGSSSYCCWLELGTPEPQRFNVSYVEVNEGGMILNLTVSTYDFEHCVELTTNENQILTMFKLWLLTIATSFTVKEKGRVFKSEYIISQMIMLACKEAGYYGVSYYSKRMVNDRFADHVCANLAIFALYNGETKVSDICRDIKLTNSMNFELFKNLKPSLKYKDACLNVTNSKRPVNIGDFERQYPYNETEFYYFDKYLVAHLEDELQAVDLEEVNGEPE